MFEKLDADNVHKVEKLLDHTVMVFSKVETQFKRESLDAFVVVISFFAWLVEYVAYNNRQSRWREHGILMPYKDEALSRLNIIEEQFDTLLASSKAAILPQCAGRVKQLKDAFKETRKHLEELKLTDVWHK